MHDICALGTAHSMDTLTHILGSKLTEAKVAELDSPLVIHQYILWLDISVDNASVMDVGKSCHELTHDIMHLMPGQALEATRRGPP